MTKFVPDCFLSRLENKQVWLWRLTRIGKLRRNHGRLFRSFMHAYLPDWEERQRNLEAVADA